MAHLVVNLLGIFHARQAGGPVLNLPTKRVQALLAYLCLRPGRLCTPANLAQLLEAEGPTTAVVLDALGALRTALGADSLVGVLMEAEGLGINRTAVDVDVLTFEQLVGENTPQSLERAVGLYRGDFLEGLTVNAPPLQLWIGAERERLREVALQALSALLDQQLGADRVEPALETAHRLLELDPLQEEAHRTVMRLYARLGRAGAALRQYQTVQELVGGQPSEETRRLYNDILGHIFRSAPAAVPGPQSILLVEDDGASRTLLDHILTAVGYEVVPATDGAQALLHLGGRTFDLVLSDINMPTLNGVQLLEIMQTHGIQTPVIFVTAYATDDARAGTPTAADYVQKPIDQDDLLQKVRAVLERSAGRRPTAREHS